VTAGARDIDAVFRIESPRLIAGLARMVRPRGPAEELAQDAVNKNLISGDEAALLRKATAARLEAIEVDVFTAEQYFGTVGKGGGLELGEAPYKRAANG